MSQNIRDTEGTARALVADGKGILAADESVSTLTKRFDALGIPSTEQSRRAYRERCSSVRPAPPSSSAASSCTTRPSGRRARPARRSPRCSRARESSPESRLIPARNRWPAHRARPSPRGSTGSATVLRSTAAWAPASRNGGRSSASPTRCRVARACARTPMPSRDTLRSVRKRASYRSWSRKC